MTKRKRIALFTLTAVLIALIIGQMLLSMLTVRSEAATTNQFYTDVFDDLSKDESFDPANYPRMTLDYYLEVNSDEDKTNDQAFMEVIQIAESTSGELYIYVYQPTHYELDLKALFVSLSTEFTPNGENINPKLYDLVLVSENGVYDKYVVKDFKVSKESERYYNIVMLERDFSDKIDEKIPGSEDEGNYFGVGVGQQWCASYINGNLVYEMNTFETVDIKIKSYGSIRVKSGITVGSFYGNFTDQDVWFVTFDVENFNVKKIFDADIHYFSQQFTKVGTDEGNISPTSEKVPNYVPLSSLETFTVKGVGLGGRSFSHKSICSSNSLLSKVLTTEGINFVDGGIVHLTNCGEWCFIFAKTYFSELSVPQYDDNGISGTYYQKDYTDISGVTIIRLHFMDVRGTYNLGAVSDMVNPDNDPDIIVEPEDPWEILWEFLKLIIEILAFIILIIILVPFIGPICTLIIEVLKFIVKIVIYLVTLPFKLLNYLFKKRE